MMSMYRLFQARHRLRPEGFSQSPRPQTDHGQQSHRAQETAPDPPEGASQQGAGQLTAVCVHPDTPWALIRPSTPFIYDIMRGAQKPLGIIH